MIALFVDPDAAFQAVLDAFWDTPASVQQVAQSDITRGFNSDQARDAHGRFLSMGNAIAEKVHLPHLPGIAHNAFLHVLELGGEKARDAKAKVLGEDAYKAHVADARAKADAAAKAMSHADAKALSDREQELRDARIVLQSDANRMQRAAERITDPARQAKALAAAAAKQREADLTMNALRVVRDQYQRYVKSSPPPVPASAPHHLPAPRMPQGAKAKQTPLQKGIKAAEKAVGRHFKRHFAREAAHATQHLLHTGHLAHHVTHNALGLLMGGHRAEVAELERTFNAAQARDGHGRFMASEAKFIKAIGERHLAMPKTLAEAHQLRAAYDPTAHAQARAAELVHAQSEVDRLAVARSTAEQTYRDLFRANPNRNDPVVKAAGDAFTRAWNDHLQAQLHLSALQRDYVHDPHLTALDAHVDALTHQQRVVYVTPETPDAHALTDAFFGRHLTNAEIGSLVGAQHGDTVTIRSTPDEVHVRLNGHNGAYVTSHTLYRQPDGSLMMYNHSVTVGESARGQGVGARILATQVAGLRRLGVSRIELTAAGNAKSSVHNGYYTWPALGFNAKLTPEEQRAWQTRLGMTKPPRSVQDIFAQPGGAAEWKTYGTEREMAFNLSPRSRGSRALSAYLQNHGIQRSDPLAPQPELLAKAGA